MVRKNKISAKDKLGTLIYQCLSHGPDLALSHEQSFVAMTTTPVYNKAVSSTCSVESYVLCRGVDGKIPAVNVKRRSRGWQGLSH